MDERAPGYYAVIPATVRYDTSIPANAKLLYGEISALLNADGLCFASNQYFADLYSVTVKSISRLISLLEQAGYIRLQIEKDKSGKVACRKICLNVSTTEEQPVDNFGEGYGQNCPVYQYIYKENKKESPPKKEHPRKTDFNPSPIFVAWIDTDVPQMLPADTLLTAREKNELYMAIVNFSENRNAMKKPIPSKAAVTAILNRLVKFSKGAPNRIAAMIDMLELATSSNWQTVYAPKDGKATTPVKPQGGRVYEEL